MSKVICDICGTSYPETSTQCPICGCVRPAESTAVLDDVNDSGGYTYVKGGRFSKANVRKRNQGKETVPVEEKKKETNKKALGLIIVLVCLILIVTSMIAVILLGWAERKSDIEGSTGTTAASANIDVPCTGLTLSQLEISMTSPGEIWILEASASPLNTTDKLVYASENEAVATVSDSGKVTCVGKGHAVITVTCGDQVAECKVSCDFEEATQPPTVAPQGIRLNRKSITADYEGFSWTLYEGDIANDQITWTSENESVATVENGVVTAVGEGVTEIHAVYNGVTTSCTITCEFEEATIPEGEGEDHGGSTPVDTGEYALYTIWNDKVPFNDDLKAYDVTISVGQSVGFVLKNSAEEEVVFNWTITDGTSCTVEENYVTVINSDSNCTLEVEYEGIVYTCFIRTVNPSG